MGAPRQIRDVHSPKIRGAARRRERALLRRRGAAADDAFFAGVAAGGVVGEGGERARAAGSGACADIHGAYVRAGLFLAWREDLDSRGAAFERFGVPDECLLLAEAEELSAEEEAAARREAA